MLSSSRSPFSWALALLLAVASFSQATPISSEDTGNALTARATAWEARHRMTSASYQSTFDDLVADQYRLTYVSGYSINDDPRFAALWEKNDGAAWVARHGMTGDSYQSQFDDLVEQGYRLRLVNGYTVGGTPRYTAIWDKSSGGAWEARHGLTSAKFQETFDSLVGQGYRLKHVSGYGKGNTALYAALWEKTGDNIAWVARHGMTYENYQSRFDEYVAQGYRLVSVSGYVVNNVDYYAAIWDKSSSSSWVARHRMSSSQYQSEFDKFVGQGYRLKLVSGYTLNNNEDRYAALWIKE